ncbi:hypothetical protein SLUN_26895 [Streptomyces lunaelactis]|uniref:Uncharacterized protein n=1 Tax=Streptomyces lunaelactis TaxID=1535768 RepID=A0A2R4T853_9ACTN|nr:hypothetical protein SLUN_26895 [Streptomyces lunaelactis]
MPEREMPLPGVLDPHGRTFGEEERAAVLPVLDSAVRCARPCGPPAVPPDHRGRRADRAGPHLRAALPVRADAAAGSSVRGQPSSLGSSAAETMSKMPQ